MNKNFDFHFTDEPIPLYYQIKTKLVEAIENNYWRPGDLVPSEREMCNLFKVSRPTIRQAINELVIEGLLKRVKGKGTFITEPKFTYGSIQDIATFYENLVGRGYKSTTKILGIGVETPTVKISDGLGISLNDKIVKIKRVRYINKDPVVIVINHIPYDLCPGLEKLNLADKSLYAIIASRYNFHLAKSKVTFYPSVADEIDAKLLNDKKGSPIQIVDNLSISTEGTRFDLFESKFKGNYGKISFETK